MRVIRLAIVAMLLIVPVYCLAETALSNDDVIKLAKIGIGDDAVIAKIRESATVDFKLDTNDLVNLKAAGVSGKIIAAMLDRSSGAVVGGVVTPESARALAGQRSEAAIDGKDGHKLLTTHNGEFHQTGFPPFTNSFMVYAGTRSSVRTTDPRPTLTIASDTAPQEWVFIAKLESDSKDNDRSLKIGSFLKGGNPFTDKSESKPDPDWVLRYSATESPKGIWHLTPNSELPPGEYGIYMKRGAILDFGVDSGGPGPTTGQ